MTTREIAKATGKEERTVRRWVNKVAVRMSAVAVKMSASSPAHPANYDLEETISIIEEGMGKNAAAIYRENAAKSTVSSVLTDRDFQMIAHIVSVAVSETMKAYDSRMRAVEEKVDRVPLLGYDETHMTVLGFCKANGITVSISGAIAHGKEAARISREEGMSIKRVPDERFGSVNSYHKAVLQKVFSL